MQLFLPRADWIALSRPLRGPMRRWWLRVGVWWLLGNLAVNALSVYIWDTYYSTFFKLGVGKALFILTDVLTGGDLGFVMPLAIVFLAVFQCNYHIDRLAEPSLGAGRLLLLRYWHSLQAIVPVLLVQLVVSVACSVAAIALNLQPGETWSTVFGGSLLLEFGPFVWEAIAACLPAYWFTVLLTAAWPHNKPVLWLVFGGLMCAALWRAALLSMGLASPFSFGVKTGGMIGYVLIEGGGWGWFLGLGLLLLLLGSLRQRWSATSLVCVALLCWALVIRISAGTPPYPIQAATSGMATLVHSPVYSAGGALVDLPWELSIDGELYPLGTSLEIPALGLSLPWPEHSLPWWLWLQIPYFGIALLLPLALLSSMPPPVASPQALASRNISPKRLSKH
jgi:hypothetical protein